MENWLGSSLNQILGWTTVRESYPRALEQGSLVGSRRNERARRRPKSEQMDGRTNEQYEKSDTFSTTTYKFVIPAAAADLQPQIRIFHLQWTSQL